MGHSLTLAVLILGIASVVEPAAGGDIEKSCPLMRSFGA